MLHFYFKAAATAASIVIEEITQRVLKGYSLDTQLQHQQQQQQQQLHRSRNAPKKMRKSTLYITTMLTFFHFSLLSQQSLGFLAPNQSISSVKPATTTTTIARDTINYRILLPWCANEKWHKDGKGRDGAKIQLNFPQLSSSTQFSSAQRKPRLPSCSCRGPGLLDDLLLWTLY